MAAPQRRGARSKQEDVSRETSGPYVPPAPPQGLSDGGRSLWSGIVDVHELDVTQLVNLEEACRAKDRLDKLDRLLRREVDAWASLKDTSPAWSEDETIEVVFDDAVSRANQTANLMKQLLAALRLPDAAGKRPQQRGGARGAYVSGGAGSGGDKDGSGGSALGGLRSVQGGRSA